MDIVGHFQSVIRCFHVHVSKIINSFNVDITTPAQTIAMKLLPDYF